MINRFSIIDHHLFHDMPRKCEKFSSQFPRAQRDVFKLLLMPKTQRLLVYDHKGHRKAANAHTEKAKPAILFNFFIKKQLK